MKNRHIQLIVVAALICVSSCYRVKGRDRHYVDFDATKTFLVQNKGVWTLLGAEEADGKTTILFWSQGRERISIQIKDGSPSLGLVRRSPEEKWEHLIDEELDGNFKLLFVD